HNAIAGQLAIHHKNHAEQSAISAHEHGLENALLEAWLMLQDGADKVLVLYANDPLAAEYEVDIEREPFAFATALLVEKGTDWHVQRDDTARATSINAEGDIGVTARLLAGQDHWTTLTPRARAGWTWTRHR